MDVHNLIQIRCLSLHLDRKYNFYARCGVSLFSGMEQWNGTVEWNSGMTTPIERFL